MKSAGAAFRTVAVCGVSTGINGGVAMRSVSKKAFEGLYEQFVANGSKAFHIKYRPTGRPTTFPGPVQRGDYRKHLCGLECYGVRFTGSSTFAVMDLDLHNGDFDIFVHQLDSLVRWASQQDARWHVQVAENDASGVHLVLALPVPVETAILRNEFKVALAKLERKEPATRKLIIEAQHLRVDLLRRNNLQCGTRGLSRCEQMVIRRSAMRPLSEIEIFPHCRSAVRLPFAPGRVMLCDRPISCPNDYWGWLSTGKETMKPEAILGYVIPRLSERSISEAADLKSSSVQFSQFQLTECFEFSEDELRVIEAKLVPCLGVDSCTAQRAVKRLLNCIANQYGEVAQTFLPNLFCDLAVHIRNRNKQSRFFRVVEEIGWIAMLTKEQWATPAEKAKGKLTRARSYVVSERFYARLGIQGWEQPALVRNVPETYKMKFFPSRMR